MTTIEQLKQNIIAKANEAESIFSQVRDEQIENGITEKFCELYDEFEKTMKTIRGMHTRFVKRYVAETYAEFSEEERENVQRSWLRTAYRFTIPSEFIKDLPQYC